MLKHTSDFTHSNYRDNVFDKSATLKAQMEADRKKREEATRIIHNYTMDYGKKVDVQNNEFQTFV